MKIQKTCDLQFGRKPTVKEMHMYTRSINQGLKLLDKEVDIILHNVSAPSITKENTGVGSLFSRTTAQKLFPFLKSHAISGIQLEPITIKTKTNPSPYTPESSAKNFLMIPLEKLASREYKNLLSQKTFRRIVENRPKTNRSNYQYVQKEYNIALKEAYEKFKKGNYLKKSFAEFKAKNGKYLQKAAIFRILSDKYKKDWTEWQGIDKNLYAPKNETEKKKASQRIRELKNKYSDEIDFFIFNQMLFDIESKKAIKFSKDFGIKLIGDSPVATPLADEWINQDLFLKGKALGCPPDLYSASGQRWGFKYFAPEKIFNPDGSLGVAGELMKKKYEEYFESFPDGLRIDHVIGLVDPFIYKVDEPIRTDNSGRIYSLPGKYKKKVGQYDNILTKIVFAAAEKFGVKKSDIICEDLGEWNKPTQRVMDKYNLSGIAVTELDYRGKDTPERNIIMLGSHDNKSFLEYIKDLFKTKDKNAKYFIDKTTKLGLDTSPKDISFNELEKKISGIQKKPKDFLEAGFVELFTSPARRVQILFTDFFGIAKTYNLPGTSSKNNWSLRVGDDFEKDYYKAVSKGEAPNFARLIANALRVTGKDEKHPKLMEKLDKLAKILSE